MDRDSTWRSFGNNLEIQLSREKKSQESVKILLAALPQGYKYPAYGTRQQGNERQSVRTAAPAVDGGRWRVARLYPDAEPLDFAPEPGHGSPGFRLVVGATGGPATDCRALLPFSSVTGDLDSG